MKILITMMIIFSFASFYVYAQEENKHIILATQLLEAIRRPDITAIENLLKSEHKALLKDKQKEYLKQASQRNILVQKTNGETFDVLASLGGFFLMMYGSAVSCLIHKQSQKLGILALCITNGIGLMALYSGLTKKNLAYRTVIAHKINDLIQKGL